MEKWGIGERGWFRAGRGASSFATGVTVATGPMLSAPGSGQDETFAGPGPVWGAV